MCSPPPRSNALAEGIKARWKAAPAQALRLRPIWQRPTQTPPTPRASGAAALVFERSCAGCHGDLSDPAKRNDAPVGSIEDPDFLALISNQALRRIIITGRPDLGMPSSADATGRGDDFRPLTAADVDALVALLADRRERSDGGVELAEP